MYSDYYLHVWSKRNKFGAIWNYFEQDIRVHNDPQATIHLCSWFHPPICACVMC